MYKQIEKSCLQCNTTYLGTKHSKYCGYTCAKESRKKRIVLCCKECSKEFEVQEWNNEAKYCSYECKYKSNSSDIINLTCENCKCSFERKEHLIRGKHSFCSHLCANEFNKGSNHYEYKESLHDKHHKLALKQWGRFIKQRDNYICQLCGENDRTILEAHHIKHRSKHPELEFDYNNGITLCLRCHSLQHIDDPRSFRLIFNKINHEKD